MTGCEARLAETGESFSEVRARRSEERVGDPPDRQLSDRDDEAPSEESDDDRA